MRYIQSKPIFILIGIIVSMLCVAGTLALSIHPVDAQETADDLKRKIVDGQAELRKIEAEIKQFEQDLTKVGAEKKTLQNAINELDLSRKKIQADVRATEQKMASADLEIQELEREIHIKELEIERDTEAIGQSFRMMDQMEGNTMIEVLLAHESMSEVWGALEEQVLLRESLREDMRALEALRTEYEYAKNRSQDKRTHLSTLKSELAGEQNVLDQTRNQKGSLLSQTKNKESNYQKILAEKKAARVDFEKAMAEYEAKLKFILDPSTIPTVGSGVLRWPIDPGVLANCANRVAAYGNTYCITQYFGNTAFAQSGAYNGNGHNGIDFGISQSTKIVSALAGTVVDVNYGTAPNCQYGMWVLVQHANGLTTLYAHLSGIAVGKGQSVSTGQLLGYSGSTGYATGPHLHFTVYATQAVSFKQYTCKSGPTVNVPVAAFSGYLNPMDYL
ncbi:MAG: peptidoglycan DD-metalloendopeptidase family protein [Candidatus Pacebacteria bacterium]|nr:peptidoglycan DD-metalloendopeptidase family protein [Candidatus Paceibacterota bacterium]